MTEPTPTGRPNARLRQSLRDMAWSLAVVLAVIGLLLLVTWRPQPDPVRVVDTAPAVTVASLQATFPVTVPTGLPEGWRPTSARWEPTGESGDEPVLHLGYVTPADEYAQVAQSAAAGPRFVAEQSDAGRPVGVVEIGGTTWEQREGERRRSLVLVDGDATVIVSGTAPWEVLVEFAASLAPPQPSP